jgi:hypothetical protein
VSRCSSRTGRGVSSLDACSFSSFECFVTWIGINLLQNREGPVEYATGPPLLAKGSGNVHQKIAPDDITPLTLDPGHKIVPATGLVLITSPAGTKLR